MNFKMQINAQAVYLKITEIALFLPLHVESLYQKDKCTWGQMKYVDEFKYCEWHYHGDIILFTKRTALGKVLNDSVVYLHFSFMESSAQFQL